MCNFIVKNWDRFLNKPAVTHKKYFAVSCKSVASGLFLKLCSPAVATKQIIMADKMFSHVKPSPQEMVCFVKKKKKPKLLCGMIS